jgi:hypothetical protein
MHNQVRIFEDVDFSKDSLFNVGEVYASSLVLEIFRDEWLRYFLLQHVKSEEAPQVTTRHVQPGPYSLPGVYQPIYNPVVSICTHVSPTGNKTFLSYVGGR